MKVMFCVSVNMEITTLMMSVINLWDGFQIGAFGELVTAIVKTEDPE